MLLRFFGNFMLASLVQPSKALSAIFFRPVKLYNSVKAVICVCPLNTVLKSETDAASP